MLLLPVTLTTAALLSIFYVVISAAVSGERRKANTGLGHGNESTIALGQEHTASRLFIAVRRHANFAEYVPLSLILLALLELAQTRRPVLLALAITLVVARVMVTLGLGLAAPNPLRLGGMALQWLMLVAASAFALIAVYVA